MEYEVVIGIEVHAQLKTKSKLFCGCSTEFGQAPNTNVCPVCLAMPGTLPVLNKKAVEFAIKAGFALNCEIQKRSVFARKNYFYPDLPKGYQISQFDLPICTKGFLDIEINNEKKKIGITRIHIEEDAGKLVHSGSAAISGADYSLVDLNRASTPLIEIVSDPDIRSATEARVYVETLKQILLYAGICDGNLEEGSLRADANISLREKGQTTLGTRTEIKNLNSFRSIEKALLIEIARQKEVLESGGKIIQQTRHYDEPNQTTKAMRGKEESHDYRYFPEPDLMPLLLTEEQIQKVKAELSELPQVKREKFQKIGLGDYEINVLLNDQEMTAYFESCLKIQSEISPKEICKWVIGDLNSLIKEKKISFTNAKLTSEKLISILQLIQSGTISGKIAKDFLPKILETGQEPASLIKEHGVAQISDEAELQVVIAKVLAENPEIVAKIKDGKTNAVNFLMGQVMKETKGQAKPDTVSKLILEKIK